MDEKAKPRGSGAWQSGNLVRWHWLGTQRRDRCRRPDPDMVCIVAPTSCRTSGKRVMGQAQLRLFSPADEAGCYHDTARQGFFSLLMATGEGSNEAGQLPAVTDARGALHARPQPGYLAVSGRVHQSPTAASSIWPVSGCCSPIWTPTASRGRRAQPRATGRRCHVPLLRRRRAAAVDPRFLWPWRASKVAAGWHLAASGAATLECLPALPDRPSGRAGR